MCEGHSSGLVKTTNGCDKNDESLVGYGHELRQFNCELSRGLERLVTERCLMHSLLRSMRGVHGTGQGTPIPYTSLVRAVSQPFFFQQLRYIAPTSKYLYIVAFPNV